jgi:mono/diheme cytochrome c family protein
MRWIGLIFAIFAATLAGCSGKPSDSSSSAPPPGGTSAVAAASQYDAGPRAGEGSIDRVLAGRGEPLFKNKGCSACHGFGQKLTGPDLNGVTMRRTAAWMEQQILHPEVMTKQDPISHALFAQYALQMPNQGLTPDEAKSVIEYLKHRNHETQEAAR